jgi:hypothetical protein
MQIYYTCIIRKLIEGLSRQKKTPPTDSGVKWRL